MIQLETLSTLFHDSYKEYFYLSTFIQRTTQESKYCFQNADTKGTVCDFLMTSSKYDYSNYNQFQQILVWPSRIYNMSPYQILKSFRPMKTELRGQRTWRIFYCV